MTSQFASFYGIQFAKRMEKFLCPLRLRYGFLSALCVCIFLTVFGSGTAIISKFT